MATSPISPGDHYFDADGVRFHYLVRGSGPLLIAQSVGWGISGSFVWNTMGPYLEKNNTAVYVEPRGNGESTRPADPTTMTAKTMAEDLEHLRKHLGLDAFPALLGGSHAGAIALRYAEQYPSRVAKLVLFSCQIMDGPPNTHTRDWIQKHKDDPAYAEAVGTLIKASGGAGPKTDEEFAESMDKLLPIYFFDTSKVDIMRRSSFGKGASPPSVYAFQTNKNDSQPENKLPQVADAGKVQAKTLIIRGAEDAMCSLVASQAVADGIAGSKFVNIPEAGHAVYIEKPDEFYGELNAFLEA